MRPPRLSPGTARARTPLSVRAASASRLFICSSADGHGARFHLLVAVPIAAMNRSGQMSESLISIFWVQGGIARQHGVLSRFSRA